MKYDLIIIGSGPAGYIAAIRAGQVGLKVAMIEKGEIGGMCLNWGCIPTKALLESAKRFYDMKNAKSFGIEGIDVKQLTFNSKTVFSRSNKIVGRLGRGIQFLMKKNNVEVIKGTAVISSPTSVSVNNSLLDTKNIMIATGSKSELGDYSIPEGLLVDVKDFIAEKNLPENPVVIGHSASGMEFSQFFSMIGKNPSLLVLGDEILPGIDETLTDFFEKKFKKEKINIIKNAKIEGYKDGNLIVNGTEIPCDAIINTTQRMAVVPDSEMNIDMENGYVKTDDEFRTNVPNIFAVGDVNGKMMSAHAASAQGLNVVDTIMGIDNKIDFARMPIQMYTYPEMSQIGLTEKQLKEKGIEYKINEFPLTANGKALTEGFTDGFVRIISDPKYGEVLGTQIVALHATDMIAEASAIMELEGTVHDMAKIVHAHPTVSEIIMEAGYDAFDQPIHK
jgi:dihydrolipoamide dehydrogenase